MKICKIPENWIQSEGENISIAVIDTGYSPHNDLEKSIMQKSSVIEEESWEDINDGHGNMCMGIISASKVNKNGINGIAPKAKIISIKCVSDNGETNYEKVIEGIYLALSLNVNIISLSMGGLYYDNELEKAVVECYCKNIPIISAAGNDGHYFKANLINYPARFKETIAVGSVDSQNDISDFSTIGPEIDFVAIGENIRSTHLNNGYKIESGTSFSAPYVAGITALLLSKHNKQEKETGLNDCKTIGQIKEHLRYHTIDAGPEGKDNVYGHGIISIDNILNDSMKSTPSGFWNRLINLLKSIWRIFT